MTGPTYPRYPAPDDVPQPEDPAAADTEATPPAVVPGGRVVGWPSRWGRSPA